MKHASNCMCMQCKLEAHLEASALLADSYTTKTQILTAESVYYNGSSWLVNYKMTPIDKQFSQNGTARNWMYVGQWNTNVRKWQKEGNHASTQAGQVRTGLDTHTSELDS